MSVVTFTPLPNIPDFSLTKSVSSYLTFDTSGQNRGVTTHHVANTLQLSSCSFGKIGLGLISTFGIGTLALNKAKNTIPKHRIHNLFHSYSGLSVNKEAVDCALIRNDIIVKPLPNH